MSPCSRKQVGKTCLGPHAPRDGFVDNDPENHTGSFSFYFSSFALFLLGGTRHGLEREKQEALPFLLLDCENYHG